MVHVEIFLGGPTGEQSIGARWHNGVVSVFDSYKFVSKSYYDMKYYFKSIDTWLQGLCKQVISLNLSDCIETFVINIYGKSTGLQWSQISSRYSPMQVSLFFF